MQAFAPLIDTGQFVSTVVGGGPLASFFSSSTTAAHGWRDTAAATDGKVWDIVATGGQLILRAANDANTAVTPIMTVSRAALVVTSVAFAAPLTLTYNGVNGMLVVGAATSSTGYCCQNTSTGGRSWSFGTTGSGGSPGPVGCFFLYDNTANALRAYWDTAGNLTLNGNLTVGSTITSPSGVGLTIRPTGSAPLSFNYTGGSGVVNFYNGAVTVVAALDGLGNWSCGDINTTSPFSGQSQGQIRFGNTGRYLIFDGSNFSFNGAALYVNGFSCNAVGFVNTSSRTLKNIVGDLPSEDAFNRVMSWLPRLYSWKADPSQRVRSGLIVDEAPAQIVDGEGIDLYAALIELGAAFQFLAAKVAHLNHGLTP